MELTIKSKEVAEAIAVNVEQATSKDCEAFTNEVCSVVVYKQTQVIARITSMFSVLDVEPIGGLFSGEVIEIPREARTLSGIQEIAHDMDKAISHVLNAAISH